MNAVEKAGVKITDETQQSLFDGIPEVAPKVTKAKDRRVKNNLTRYPVNFNDKQMTKLKRVRE